jgi:folate-binding protein YgfZ
MTHLAALPDRGVIELTGADRVTFLQGLVSNDVARAGPGAAVWAALLTPQGKYLSDFFIFAADDRLLLDVQRDQLDLVVSRLTKFRLRARVIMRDLSDAVFVHAAWGGAVSLPADAIAAPDPRLAEAGWRILSATALPATASAEDWQAHRLSLGLPAPADLEAEKSVLLEAGFDELHGVSWSKGCYMGQELTARTKYRGLVKRRLVPVAVDGPLPAPGTPVLRDGVDIGSMRSGRGTQGMAQLRLEAIRGGTLLCGDAVLTPRQPDWMVLPEAVA